MSQYRLAKGVTFQENPGHTGVTFQENRGNTVGILFIRYPQRIIRLSANGTEAIKKLCGQAPGVESGDEQLSAFAGELEKQGVLIRCFPPVADEQLPEVSVVIPTYNRGKMLTSCLESLFAVDYPAAKLEIIVVDDASPVPVNPEAISNPVIQFNGCGPGAADLASGEMPAASASGRISVKVIRLPENRGPGAARNAAVQQAKGEIIAFLDDDCLASNGWLKALIPCFQYPDVAAAGGRVESARLTRPLEKYEQVQSPLLMGENQRKVEKGSSLSYLATCNLLVRKQALLAAGGFDPELRVGEDVDLCWRLQEKGGNIYYVPEGLVFHHHRSKLLPFLKRRFNYGQSEAKLHTRNPKNKRMLVFFPGNRAILAITILSALFAGIWPALAAGIGLTALNLFRQSVRKLRSIKSADCKPALRQVLPAMLRSQGTAVYLGSQHFSRYYSIPATGIALFSFPRLVPLFLAIHLLPGLVDYKLKKPSLTPFHFTLYHFLENIFYQAGVFSGCLSEKSWQPLTMKFIRADANLLQVLATEK